MTIYPTVDSLVSGAENIASPPRIHQRITEALTNPTVDLNEIAELVAKDSGLTMRLLRLVNSAFFAFKQKIESINDAVAAIGVQQVCDLALTTSVTRIFKGVPEELVEMESFWRHSLACALAARALAINRNEAGPVESYFVAGMLHDVGRLIMFARMPEATREALVYSRKLNQPLIAAEKQMFGYDHAEVGAALMEIWSLPKSLSEATHFHHQPAACDHFEDLASTVHVADLIAHALEYGSSGEPFVPKLVPSAWDRCGIEPDSLADIVAQVDQQFKNLIHALKAARR